jgi:hypothetical protein
VDVLERKILRRIYGPVKDRDQWRCRFNKKLYDLFKEPRPGVGNLFMLEGRINLAVIK